MAAETYGADLFALSRSTSVGNFAKLSAAAGAYAQAGVSTDRGFNFNASLGSYLSGAANVQKFVAASLKGEAKLRLELIAQAQFPLDFFTECGAVCRLSAAAEAGVYGSLSVGLALEDFRRAFVKDQSGIALRLGEIFLDEVVVEGGVWAKAAITAQAMVNCSIAGSLLPDPRTRRVPGFVASFDWGLGFLYGTGMAFFARIGFRDPKRLVSRTADELTAIALELVEKKGGRDVKATVPYARMLLPVAIRASYELGVLSVQESGTGARTKARERLAEIVRTEASGFASELLVATGLVRMRKLMEDPAIAAAAKALTADKAAAARKALEDFQAALPKRPSLTSVPKLIDPFLDFVRIVAPAKRAEWIDAAATVWSALAVLAAGRAAATGAKGADIALPGTSVLEHMRKAVTDSPQLGSPSTKAMLLAAQFLIARSELDVAMRSVPEAAEAIAWLRALFPGMDLSTVLFGDAQPRALADDAWAALKEGLRRAARDKLEGEVAALLDRAGGDEQAKEFVHSVVKPAVLSLGDVVIEQVDSLGSAHGRVVFREQVSLLLLQIVGRNVVFCGDILLARALTEASRGMRSLASELRGNGRVEFLNIADSALKVGGQGSARSKLIDILELGAGLAEIWDEKERAKLRTSLLDMMDLLGTRRGGDAKVWQKIASNKKYLPNAKQLKAFLKSTLAQLGRLVLRAVLLYFQQMFVDLKELVRTVGKALLEAAKSWLKVLDTAVRQLKETLRNIVASVKAIAKQVASLVTNVKSHVRAFRERLRSKQFRDHALRQLRGLGEKGVLAALNAYPPYRIIPKFLRKGADGIARKAYRAAFDVTFRPVLGAALDAVVRIVSVLPQAAGPEALSAQLEAAGTDHRAALRSAFAGKKGVSISFKIAKKRIKLLIPLPIDQLVRSLSDLISADQVVKRALAANQDIQRRLGALQKDRQRTEGQQRQQQQKVAQAQQKVAQTKTGALRVDLASPKTGEVHASSVLIDAVVRGGNASLIEPPSGGKRRVEVLVDGKPLAFHRQDWTVSGNELRFRHKLTAGARPSRTVNVLVTDGRAQQAAASAAFGLVA